MEPLKLEKQVEQAFALAQERYAALGVNTASALERLRSFPVSLQCWQGDDIGGFENSSQMLGGGLAVTGNYPGKARTPKELRRDIDHALSLIPGSHRLSLHACYAETHGARVERTALEAEHFGNWIAWAKSRNIGLDFNPTFFAHPLASSGFTLSSEDKSVRQFWVEHGKACRHIGAAFGKALGKPCVTNFWAPDGYKDTPFGRKSPRERLSESLDAIFKEPIAPELNLDAVEPKLFGIGSESYTVGSYDFYLGYAITRQKLLCLDAGHFHPTETISDKISSVLQYLPGILLHVSRGVRWDSDHVVTLTDELLAIAQETVRGNYGAGIHLGLDYFDASINRVAAWVIGARNVIKALLVALLEPTELLSRFEREGDYTSRLALLEDLKLLPFGAVWDYYCATSGVPPGYAWVGEIKSYERDVLSHRLS